MQNRPAIKVVTIIKDSKGNILCMYSMAILIQFNSFKVEINALWYIM